MCTYAVAHGAREGLCSLSGQLEPWVHIRISTWSTCELCRDVSTETAVMTTTLSQSLRRALIPILKFIDVEVVPIHCGWHICMAVYG